MPLRARHHRPTEPTGPAGHDDDQCHSGSAAAASRSTSAYRTLRFNLAERAVMMPLLDRGPIAPGAEPEATVLPI